MDEVTTPEVTPTPEPKKKEKPAKTERETLNFTVPLSAIVLPKDIEWNRDGTKGSNELVASMKEIGQTTALVVRKTADDIYELIDGRRRYMAMKEAGIKTAFITFMDGDNTEAKKKALVANLNRKAHDSIELSDIFNDLVACGCSNREIARMGGVSDGFVSQHLALKNLSDTLRTSVTKGNLSVTQARELLRIDQEKYADGFEKMAEKALGGMDAAQLKDSVTSFLEKKKAQEEKKEDKKEAAPGEKKKPKKEEVKKGRPVKTKQYDSALIKMVTKTELIAKLEAAEVLRAKSTSTLRQRYLAGYRDGLEDAGGLRNDD